MMACAGTIASSGTMLRTVHLYARRWEMVRPDTFGDECITGHSPSRLLFLTDKYSGCRFLVDTGAEVSVILPSAAD